MTSVPPDKAAIVLFVPREAIIGLTPLDVQKDVGLPWYGENMDPVWFDELPGIAGIIPAD